MNHIIDKVKPQGKLLYKLFKQQDVYDPLLCISPFPTLIQFKYLIGGIQHCVTVVSKWVFDSNFPFALPLTCVDMDYCFTNDNETKVINGYKVLLKAIRFFTTYKYTSFIQK